MRGISGNLAEWVSRERRSAPPPAVASPFDGGPTSDVDFLAAFGVPDALLAAAAARAVHFGTRARAELLATGFPRERYWGLLAEALGVEYVDDLAAAVPVANTGLLATDAVRDATALPVTIDGREILLVAPDRQKLAGLSERLAAMPALRARVRIAAPETIRAFIVRHHHRSLAHYAVNRLARVMPALSSGPSSQRGASGAVALLAAPLAMTLTAPSAALFAIELFATLFFLNCSVWKLATAFGRARRRRMEPLFDDQLPTYTVLVPLYREADVAEDLVQHLGALDYPALCIKSTKLAAAN